MERRQWFFASFVGLLGIASARHASTSDRPHDGFLAAGRRHDLLASEVADGIAFRPASDTGEAVLTVEFKRYGSTPRVIKSLQLDAGANSPGLYVRGPMPWSLRLVTAGASAARPETRVVFERPARVRVYRERDESWPAGTAQFVLVVTPAEAD